MGPAPDEKLVEIYDSFDAFFFPTKEEGFGLPIIEAQARGVPVIVFKDARIPEEACNYCIRINNDLLNIEEILSLKNQFYEKIIQYSKKFAWKNIMPNILNIYKSLL